MMKVQVHMIHIQIFKNQVYVIHLYSFTLFACPIMKKLYVSEQNVYQDYALPPKLKFGKQATACLRH